MVLRGVEGGYGQEELSSWRLGVVWIEEINEIDETEDK